MDILTCPWEPAKFLIISSNVPTLLYYSHGVAVLSALIFGVFLLCKKRDLSTIIFFIISILFSCWILLDLIEWASNRNDIIYFFWVVMILIELLVYALAFYLANVFFRKTDISFLNKLLLFVFLLPAIILLPTRYILTETNASTCVPIESKFIIYYSYAFEILISFFIIASYIKSFRIESSSVNRKKITLFTIGIIVFLLAFSSGNIIGSFTEDWNLAQYGLFGMPIFMGFLAYIIVKFRAFNVKMIGTQALVATLFILILLQFTFIQIPINKVLNSIALVLITGFGYILIQSVKREIAQKEALALANNEISERKDQLQKISDHLAVANAKLKELDTAKSEFVSIVAHQLQGPPTTVKGYSMLLNDGSYGEMNDQQKDVLQKIFNANEQQIEFVNDLLNVSRMESGRVSFTFEKCNVVDICQEVMDNLFIKAKDKNLYLEYKKTNNNIPAINVDKAKIREAITNLMDNAIKYTKKGGVTLAIKVCDGTEKCLTGNHIRIVIADTGIGVPQSEMIHLFSKFSRGKDVKRLNAGGTGLGLYVVKMIVEGNHGQVWIESEGEGKGSRFIVELPIG